MKLYIINGELRESSKPFSVQVEYPHRPSMLLMNFLGADPYAQNICGRTALDLALIENGDRRLFIPWVITFDSYGYVAEEMLVRCFMISMETCFQGKISISESIAEMDDAMGDCGTDVFFIGPQSKTVSQKIVNCLRWLLFEKSVVYH